MERTIKITIPEPGTVENTQLNETQAEVFKEVTEPSSILERNMINKIIAIFKENPSKLTNMQQKQLEKYKEKYPESYKKKCQ